ncbi:MAG: hypothetical protein BMS9Abin18_0271 [Zetaproteobacteria bacterium]|nr:MAG: hypothetical protein BMS9Abin18_0271 [Zetaproteobacteria bacterium]
MPLASETPIPVSHNHFSRMYQFVCVMWQLKQYPEYLAGLQSELPETAGIEPEIPSVLMGYDFHLTPDGPKLIEINNNAGGLYIDDGSEGNGRWLPQPELPEWHESLTARLCNMFPATWRHIAIMDENVGQQYMYPEMLAYAELLENEGRDVCIVSPGDIKIRLDGLYVKEVRLDAIYNRHTDFYLEQPELAHIRKAYEKGLVQLNPHPRSYALLGDKGRMVDWWKKGFLEDFLPREEVKLIRNIVPESRRLKNVDSEAIWHERKQWVFKPAARHGGKGVVLGKAMSRKRFAELAPEETILQRYVPPSMVELKGEHFKLDVRLYTHGSRLLALAGRIWQGQVTNFRTKGSGWVPLSIV